MKKNVSIDKTLWKVMRITLYQLLLMTVGVSITAAHSSGAQNVLSRQVSISMEQAKLGSLLEKIERAAAVKFVYSTKINSGERVSLHATGRPLSEVLDELLTPLQISYEVIDSRILLRRKIQPVPKASGIVIPETDIDRQVTGRVTDEKGEALPGVNILVKGTQQGTVTDPGGTFRLSIPDGDAVLVFSFVGYTSREVEVGNQSTLEISLSVDQKALEEVVVVGYGTQQKKDLTGSLSTVSSREIVGRKALQVSEALQGTMSGVTVTRNNGAPGGAPTIRIRGMTTIGENSPLVIIDGIPGSLHNLNPNDVESITVLKDAASASIYGSRAAAGVILVTTKRATDGISQFEYNGDYGVQSPTALPSQVDAVRYLELFNEFFTNDGANAPYTADYIKNYASNNLSNPDLFPNTNWQKAVLKNGAPRQNHNVSFTIGTPKLKTIATLGYSNADGLYVNKSFERYTVRVNNDMKINRFLDANFDLSYINSSYLSPAGESTARDRNPFYTARNLPPIYKDRFSDGRWGTGKEGINALAQLEDGGQDRENNHLLSARLGFKITPVKGLLVTGIVSPRFDFTKLKQFSKVIEFTDLSDPTRVIYRNQSNTTLNEGRTESFTFNGQFLANYSKTIGSSHNVDILAGYEENYNKLEAVAASRGEFILTDFPYLSVGSLALRDNSGNATEYALRSVFGRVQYNFKSRYYLQANLRRDGSSRFHPDYRWALFPSLALGWTISEEPFLNSGRSTYYLKLRGSWGQVGNERIGNYPYQSSISFSNALFYQGTNKVSVTTGAQSSYAIPNISWETSESIDLGVDLGLFNDRLNASLDIYKKKTRDILLQLDIPRFLGYANPNQNAGVMQSTGWDLELGWRDRAGNLNYFVNVNLSDSRTKILDLKGTQLLGLQARIEGGEFNEWFGYRSAGLFQSQQEVDSSPLLTTTTKPGDVRYMDIDGDGKITPGKDKVLLGGSLPRYIYGTTLGLDYKGLDFNLVIQGVGKILSRLNNVQVEPFQEGFGNVPSEIDHKFWSPANTAEQNLDAKYPRLSKASRNSNYEMSDFWLISGAYTRLKNITVGYTFPKSAGSKAGLSNIRVFLAANDIFSIHHFPKGWDPETDATTYPIVKTIMAGVGIKL